MIAGSLLRIAGESLMANKLRSTLTFIGVVFGVTSVMTIISALEGFMGAVEEDLSALGPATFVVQRFGMTADEDEFFEMLKRKPIKRESAELIKESCNLVDKVSVRTGTRARVKYGTTALRNVPIRAAEASFVDIVDIEVNQGRFHSYEDDLYRRRVAFIGETIREEFFAGVDPIGKRIKINGNPYTVIGVAKKRGSALGGENEDNYVVIPISSFVRQFAEPRFGYAIFVKALSVEALQEAIDEVRLVLRSQRHVPYNKDDDFAILTADAILDILNQFTKLLRFALVGISSISLVVGGIVVMNIMMVSVTERTREIGIRKSLGAKQAHILSQFLFEALMLTLFGGVVGVALGFLIARIGIGQLGMKIDPSGIAIFFGLFISTGVGLFFGIVPAIKASRLDPVKALSYE